MRIVAGKHRSRLLLSPPEEDNALRPTGDRVRQALFNILEHASWGLGTFEGQQVLDAFCGTGALGLEALSRGAAHATFLDNRRDSLDLAQRNAAQLKEDSHSTFILADATKPPPATRPCTLVFLDPPYGQTLIPKALTGLAVQGWFVPEALIVAEMSERDARTFVTPPPFTLLDTRDYGKTTVKFLRFKYRV